MEYSPMMLIVIWALTPSDCRPTQNGSQEAVVREVAGSQFKAIPNPGYFTFNEGKPFLLEKNPLTGAIDFNLKTTPAIYPERTEDYSYEDEEPSIERKDTNVPSTANELAGHDLHKFLNLPAHYPSQGKYPLISSSYANTKVQGHGSSVYSNHRTHSTTAPPTYYNINTTTTAKPTTTSQLTDKPSTTTATTTIRTTTTTTTTTRRPETTTNSLNSHSYLQYNEYDYFDYDYDKTVPEPPKEELHKINAPLTAPELNAHSYSNKTAQNVTIGKEEEPLRPSNNLVVFPDTRPGSNSTFTPLNETHGTDKNEEGSPPWRVDEKNEVKGEDHYNDKPTSAKTPLQLEPVAESSQKEVSTLKENENIYSLKMKSNTSITDRENDKPAISSGQEVSHNKPKEEVNPQTKGTTERSTPNATLPHRSPTAQQVFPSNQDAFQDGQGTHRPIHHQQQTDHSTQHFAIVRPEPILPNIQPTTLSYSQGLNRPQQSTPQKHPAEHFTVVRPETARPQTGQPQSYSQGVYRPQLPPQIQQSPAHPPEHLAVVRPETSRPHTGHVQSNSHVANRHQQPNQNQQASAHQPEHFAIVRPETGQPLRPQASQSPERESLTQPYHPLPADHYTAVRPQAVFPQGHEADHSQFSGQNMANNRPPQVFAEHLAVVRPQSVFTQPQGENTVRPRPTLQQQQSTELYAGLDLRPPVQPTGFRPSRPDGHLQAATTAHRPYEGRLPPRPTTDPLQVEMRPQHNGGVSHFARPIPTDGAIFHNRPDESSHNPATDNQFIRVTPGQVGPTYSLQTSFSIGVPPKDAASSQSQGVGQVLFPDEGHFNEGEEQSARPGPLDNRHEATGRPARPVRPSVPFGPHQPSEPYPRPHWENQWGRPPQFFNNLQKADVAPPYKRIKQPQPNLPNILPQFRPNAKIGQAHFGGPPLREPPDTLQPPPLPRPQHLRQPGPEQAVHRRTGPQVTTLQMMRQGPPRRGVLRADYKGEEEQGVEEEEEEEPVFVVYPTNKDWPGITGHREEGVVVVGTRGPHTPLAPDNLGLDDIFDRVDTPVLKGKPGPKPNLKNEFPYPLIKPRPESEVVATEEYTAFSPSIVSEETTPEIDDLEINVIPNLQDYMPVATKKPSRPVEPPTWNLGDGSTVRPISVTLNTRPVTNHRDEGEGPKPQDFQAPFHASLSAPSQGWTVVSSTQAPHKETPAETTTEPPLQETKFDAQNFKPQLFGGFKPILPPVIEPQTPRDKEKKEEEEDSGEDGLFR